MGVVELLLGVIFAICVGIGVSMTPSALTAGEFWAARVCFVIAAVALCAAYFYWLHEGDRNQYLRIFFGIVVGVLAIVGTTEAIYWVNNREQALTQQNKSTTPPDVAIRFVYSKSPALILVNKSSVIARNIKWTVALWNMDLPDRNDPLPIPVSTFDWIRPHEEGGPQNLFESPLVSPLLKPGNRLFGSAAVSCPECARGRTYIVYIVWGHNGWFSEVESEKSGKILIPPNFLKASRIEYFKRLEATIPAQSRTPIGER